MPPQTAEVRPFWEQTEVRIPQGTEGQQIRDVLETISRHWEQQTSADLTMTEEELLEKYNNYRLAPLEKAGTVRVRVVGIRNFPPPQVHVDFDEIE